MIKSKIRIIELDAFRGIAALLVVLFHYTFQSTFYSVFNVGTTGVDLFFIISGFVIFLTLKNTASSRSFLLNRFSRLFPTYWTCVAIAFFLKIWSEHLNVVTMLPVFLANLTMLQLNVFKQPFLDNSYWTMTIEMLFYIFMLLLFQFKLLKSIDWIGFLLTAVCFFNTLFRHEFVRLHDFLAFRLPLISHFPLFFAGILFYKLKFEGKSLTRYVFLLLTFFVGIYLFGDGDKASIFISRGQYSLVLFAYYCIFFAYVHWGIGVLVNRVTVFLGNISYSLYLIHQYLGLSIIIPFLNKVFNVDYTKVGYIYTLITSLIIALLIATIINAYIEKPAMAFLRHKKKLKNVEELLTEV